MNKDYHIVTLDDDGKPSIVKTETIATEYTIGQLLLSDVLAPEDMRDSWFGKNL